MRNGAGLLPAPTKMSLNLNPEGLGDRNRFPRLFLRGGEIRVPRRHVVAKTVSLESPLEGVLFTIPFANTEQVFFSANQPLTVGQSRRAKAIFSQGIFRNHF